MKDLRESNCEFPSAGTSWTLVFIFDEWKMNQSLLILHMHIQLIVATTASLYIALELASRNRYLTRAKSTPEQGRDLPARVDHPVVDSKPRECWIDLASEEEDAVASLFRIR